MTAERFTHFNPKALTFLRALKRNNDREWFRPRKEEYERLLRAPMAALVEQMAVDFRRFAPDLVATPKTALYRIYRDTRFSGDKTPLKTHVGALFPCRGLEKHAGAGLYLEIAPGWVWVGGGMYRPDTSHLQVVREHIAANTKRLRTIVNAPGFKKTVGTLEGEKLTRVPRAFSKDHPAAEFLRHKQFLAFAEFPASFATSPTFYDEVVKVFRQVAPLVTFLNEPLLAAAKPAVFTSGWE